MTETNIDRSPAHLLRPGSASAYFLGAALVLGITTGALVTTGTSACSILFKTLPCEDSEKLVLLAIHSSELGWTLSLSLAMTRELRDDDWHVDTAAVDRSRDPTGRGDEVRNNAAFQNGLQNGPGFAPWPIAAFCPTMPTRRVIGCTAP